MSVYGVSKIGVGTLKISEKAKRYVNQALDSNRLSYGPFLRKFEEEFAEVHDSKFAVSSNSGTSSLQVALQAMKEVYSWADGDEVIVPAITFVATSNIVLHNSMTPVFVDVEKEFYCIDPALIEAKITPRTRAIIVVHLFGLPCDMDPILEIAKKHDLKIIEDSCETMFACYKGKKVGNLGDIGCFSTYVAHLLTTGVGGLSLTNNPEYAVAMRSLVNHGRDAIYISIDDTGVGSRGRGKKVTSGTFTITTNGPDPAALFASLLERDEEGLGLIQVDDNRKTMRAAAEEIIAKRFSFVSVGHSFRITEMEGALGLAQLEDWPQMIDARRENAQYLIAGLQDLADKMQLPKIRPECDHSFMMFPIVLREVGIKKSLVNFLEKNGIETRDMLPLINQPIYIEMFNIDENDYPVAAWINKNGFYVGCHQDLEKKDFDYIIRTMKSFFARNRA